MIGRFKKTEKYQGSRSAPRQSTEPFIGYWFKVGPSLLPLDSFLLHSVPSLYGRGGILSFNILCSSFPDRSIVPDQQGFKHLEKTLNNSRVLRTYSPSYYLFTDQNDLVTRTDMRSEATFVSPFVAGVSAPHLPDEAIRIQIGVRLSRSS